MRAMAEISKPCSVDLVLFDFGGVIAEEGFLNGLLSIAEMNGLEPEAFAETGFDLIHATGYLVGRVEEPVYWQAIRKVTGIKNDDESLRKEILKRFVLRSWMMDVVKTLKDSGIHLGMLSDQTNWLDELDSKYGLFHWFDFVFNSYHQGKSKRDPATFDDVLEAMGIEAKRVLFVDDRPGNVERAREKGIQTILYRDRDSFMEQLRRYCPGVEPPQ
jgi:HAD superfamily hydrolase (TIGR01509 family)